MVKLVGIKYLDYLSKKTNKPIKGYNLFFLEDDVKDVVGSICFDSFVSCDVYDSFFKPIGFDTPIELLYNRYGNVIGCVKHK